MINTICRFCIYICLVSLSYTSLISAADTIQVPDFNTSPEEFLDRMAQCIDKGNDRITQSHLDTIHHNEWDFEDGYQISNTLDALRKRLVPYIQRAVYLGLAWAVIVLVILWFKLVLASLEGNNQLAEKLTSTLKSLIVWLVWLTGFYFILKLALSVIANFTS